MEKHKKSGAGTFLNGFFSSGFNSVLMMGIYATVMKLGGMLLPNIGFFHHFFVLGGSAAAAVGATPFLPIAAAVIIASALFGGAMSIMRAGRERKEAAQMATTQESSRAPSQEIAPVLVPAIAADRADDQAATQTKWADRVGGPTNDNVSEILNRGMSDKDRAAAILADRQQASASQQTR